MGKYLTAPVPSTEMPKGIPYIVGNEAAERFSFYGMKNILVVFLTHYLLTASGQEAPLSDQAAREINHWFTATAYFFPILGALLADAVLGKFRTIMILSFGYCFGHLSLALMDMPASFLQSTMPPKNFLLLGLMLIAVGSGGIKPCVSANVGDQFGASNRHLLGKVFGWFYFSINFGSFFSSLLTPWLLHNKHFGPRWAFGVPGVLMAIATLVFWLGRRRFVHIPPQGMDFVRRTFFSREGLGVIAKLVPIYIFVSVFWSLYDQSGGAWVEQADKMKLTFAGITWYESQVQAVNPLLILIYIPLFTYVIYPAINKVFKLTPVRKIGLGLFITVLAFALSTQIESWVEKAQGDFKPQVAAAVAGNTIDMAATAKLAGETGHVAALTRIEQQGGAATLFIPATASGLLKPAPKADEPPGLANEVSLLFATNAGQLTVKVPAGATLGDMKHLITKAAEPPEGSDAAPLVSAAVFDPPDAETATLLVAHSAFASLATQKGADGAVVPKEGLNAEKLRAAVLTASDSPLDPKAGWTMGQVRTLLAKLEGGLVIRAAGFGGDSMIEVTASGPGAAAWKGRDLWRGSETMKAAGVEASAAGGKALVGALVDGTVLVQAGAAPIRSNVPGIEWQIIAYLILTVAEVMVSITCLEFSYTQAPPQMKSFVMSLYLLSVSAGNAFTALVNHFTVDALGDSTLEGPAYYQFFTLVMLGAACVFVVVGFLYKPREYIQAEKPVKEQDLEEAVAA